MTALAWLSARHAPTNAAATAGGTMVRSATGIASASAPSTSASGASVDVPVTAAVTNEGMAIFPAGMTGAPLEVADADKDALTGVGDA